MRKEHPMGDGVGLKVVAAIQVLVAMAALGMGGATGWYIGRDRLQKEQDAILQMSAQDAVQKIQALQDQYQALVDRCQPLEESERDKLIETQQKVEDLRSQITEREAEVARLEIKAKENVSLKRELEKKKAELADLVVQLETAEKERAQLVEKLQSAYEEVSVQKAQTVAAKQETMAVRWDEFKARSIIEICEKGTKNKMEKCRTTVEAAFTPAREQLYKECARKKGAVPTLRHRQKNEKELPSFAQWVDESSKFTKDDWYILFCDPTLPEAGDNAVVPSGAPSEEDALLKELDEEEKEK